MYDNALIKAGLTLKQAKIYLACLELGQGTIPKIAKYAGIKRTTTYGIVDELCDLRLLKSSVKGKSQTYQAEDPENLVDLLESKKQNVQSVLPGLKELFNTHNIRPQMRFYEGKEGVKKIYEDILECSSKKVLQVVKVKEHIQALGKYSEEYFKRRAEKGIMAYDLHPKSGDIYTAQRGTTNAKYKRMVRYLPPDVFHAAMIMIYDYKVAMISTKKENFGFIIESKEFSDTLKSYFEYMWKLSSKDPEI